jgi:hypothetical protein
MTFLKADFETGRKILFFGCIFYLLENLFHFQGLKVEKSVEMS